MIDDSPGRWPERSKVTRIYHPHTEQEDVLAGMWERPAAKEAKEWAEDAAKLMSDVSVFEAAMRRALKEWPKACEHNLTASVNRKAWIGHAGCFLATESRESSTRAGWHLLDRARQRDANAAAARVISTWEAARAKQQNARMLAGEQTRMEF